MAHEKGTKYTLTHDLAELGEEGVIEFQINPWEEGRKQIEEEEEEVGTEGAQCLWKNPNTVYLELEFHSNKTTAFVILLSEVEQLVE